MTDDDVWWGTVRVRTPPTPVLVDLTIALPPSRVVARGVPLRVRASGIDLLPVAGQLLSWHQLATGDWYALVEMRLTNRTGRGALPVQQLVPAAAVRRRGLDD